VQSQAFLHTPRQSEPQNAAPIDLRRVGTFEDKGMHKDNDAVIGTAAKGDCSE